MAARNRAGACGRGDMILFVSLNVRPAKTRSLSSGSFATWLAPLALMNHLSRRSFIRSTALISAAAFTARSWGQVAGANSDVRVAIVGLNGRGKNHYQSLKQIPGVRVVALCDPDQAVLTRSVNTWGGGMTLYPDIRELLAARDVDAITIATPNHWHSLSGIWACQAGKD